MIKSDYAMLRRDFLEHFGYPRNSVFAGPIRVIVSEWMRDLCYQHGWGLHEFLDQFEKDCL